MTSLHYEAPEREHPDDQHQIETPAPEAAVRRHGLTATYYRRHKPDLPDDDTTLVLAADQADADWRAGKPVDKFTQADLDAVRARFPNREVSHA